MPEITIAPATANDWDATATTMTGGGDGKTCWCQWWMLPNADFAALTTDDKRERLHDELASASPAPALIAYVDGEAAGWVRIGPRTEQKRLARTQLVKQGTAEPMEAADVWALSCLIVRREYRGNGLMPLLVSAAVEFARTNGARVVEAYPVDTTGAKASSNDLYHGVASVFAAAGFEVTGLPKPQRPVMALTL